MQEFKIKSITPDTYMPHSIEAEKGLLGRILLDDTKFEEVIETLEAKDFYLYKHQIIFNAMCELHIKRLRIDMVSLQDNLTKTQELDTVGGLVYFVELQEDLPFQHGVSHAISIIRDHSIRRKLIMNSLNTITMCKTSDSLEDVIDASQQQIMNINARLNEEDFIFVNMLLKKTFSEITETKQCSKGITGIPSGLKNLDKLTAGFQKGDLIILAARPSMGKTALALNITANAASEGNAVAFLSIEMASQQLMLRLLAAESAIMHQNIKNATISPQEWIELTDIAAKIAEWKLLVRDIPATINELRSKVRKLKLKHNIQLLIVDYLQLLTSSKKHESRHIEVSEISRLLKSLAKELYIPIIALSQLSRTVDARADKRPLLSDLRESGAIEQDADLIMFLYRDVVYNPETENPAHAELIIGKHRNGPTGTIPLNFLREITKFEEPL